MGTESGTETETETQILEINLISAQGLKPPVANIRRMQTYALVWVDPFTKLRSRVDRVGGESPTWNDKFLFRVSPEFISGDTSGVSVEIYAVGHFRDSVVGFVRFLLSNCISKNAASAAGIGTPAFTAVLIQRPSGKFQGILNIAASIYSSSDCVALGGLSAACCRDLMKEKQGEKWRRRLSRGGSKRSDKSSGGESSDFDIASLDLSDGNESTTSSSSTTSNALKEWNGLRNELAGKKGLIGKGSLCGLMLQRKIPLCPSDQNLHDWDDSFDKEG